jgi:hypothetical protein
VRADRLVAGNGPGAVTTVASRQRRRRYGAGEAARRRHAWMDLIATSGPFLTLPVVNRVFPDGLPTVPVRDRSTLRVAVETMLDSGGATRREAITLLLREVLNWGPRLLEGDQIPANLAEPIPGHAGVITPDFAFHVGDDTDPAGDGSGGEGIETGIDGAAGGDADRDGDADNRAEPAADGVGDLDDDGADDGEASDDGDAEDADDEGAATAEGPWRLLGIIVPWGDRPLARVSRDGWAASPVERLAVLLRARDVPIGLVTDGRWWALVWAPIGGTTAAAVWDADKFSAEPETLQALVALLTRSRFLAVAPGDTLPALFHESLSAQEEVTVTLGIQVRDAVEMLIATLDRLDGESGGRLLRRSAADDTGGGDIVGIGDSESISDDEFYDGVVTVMMRIVFLLFAEERRLLPSDDYLYETGYGIGQLVDQLETRAALSGEHELENHFGAWHRLLATTRALHRGVAHEDLRLPAYGGGLFDPDRYPWLEGRASTADNPAAVPPRVDDRTVLHMLRAVQYVTIDGQRRRLTFRALDVEQIGYVYEGLLELEVRTATEVTLGLQRRTSGTKRWPKGKPEEAAEIPLSAATAWLDEPPAHLRKQLAARTGWSASRVQKELVRILEAHERTAISRAVGGDEALAEQILPIAPALRWSERGIPAITLPGRRYIAPSTRRAATGTHYTPRDLAEDVVNNALEPLLYRPGPLETAERNDWQIRPSSEIQALRVADIAMGSGAFLVAACRYLADRLLDAWVAEGRADAMAASVRRARGGSSDGRRPGDTDVEHVLLEARRLVAEHCLYGADINPLAVEMAKLSLWLVTMDKERPFGFLDDRLICGDSLLGLTSIDQLETLHVDPVDGRKLSAGALDYTAGWRETLARAADLRRRITATPVVTIRDVQHKQRLLAEAHALSRSLTEVADAITGVGLRVAKANKKQTDIAFLTLAMHVATEVGRQKITTQAQHDLQDGRPPGTVERRPLHWPLAFPEVFVDAADTGFDAIVGNPPFNGGQKISGDLGKDYLAWLQRWDGREVKGSADLAARFVLRAEKLLSSRGELGYITTNTLVQGDTLEVGLLQITERGLTMRRGQSSHPWPSDSASLEIVGVWVSRMPLAVGVLPWLDGEQVPSIGADLEPVGRVKGRPFGLAENENIAFQGSTILGLGFTMTPTAARELIERDPRNVDALQPYVIGKDLNQRPDCSASRWVINFHDWPLERAEMYPGLIDIVRREVKPERDRNKYSSNARERWWEFERRRPELYDAIADLDHVLAIALVSNSVMPVRVKTGVVFAHKCAIFALPDFAWLAVLDSNVHFTWVVRYTSTLGAGINYSPTDIFSTFPRPEPTERLEQLGKRLDTERRELMLSRSWGLTTTYNHVHDPADRDPAIVALRDLHAEIDYAVLDAYGWSGLDLQIGHHKTKIGTRWTVSPEARFELLDLLLEENYRRHALEAGES